MKLSVRFREKFGTPFSIEKLSGTQFRCGICGRIFYDRKELDVHLRNEAKRNDGKAVFPPLNKNVSVTVVYSLDVNEAVNPNRPRLNKGDNPYKQGDKRYAE